MPYASYRLPPPPVLPLVAVYLLHVLHTHLIQRRIFYYTYNVLPTTPFLILLPFIASA